MSNEKKFEKNFGRKPKGSNRKSNSSWVRTVPNGKLKGGSRWGKYRKSIESDRLRLRFGDLEGEALKVKQRKEGEGS